MQCGCSTVLMEVQQQRTSGDVAATWRRWVGSAGGRSGEHCKHCKHLLCILVCTMAPRQRLAPRSGEAAPASLPDALLERILGLLDRCDRRGAGGKGHP